MRKNLVAVLAIVAACAVAPIGMGIVRGEAMVRVHNQSYEVSDFRLMCDGGRRLLDIKGMDLNGRYRRKFEVGSCLNVYWMVRQRGGRVWRVFGAGGSHYFTVPTGPGSVTCVTIGPTVYQSHFEDCTSYVDYMR